MTKGLVIFGGVLLTFATGCIPRAELSPSTPVAYHTEAPHMCRNGQRKSHPSLGRVAVVSGSVSTPISTMLLVVLITTV